MPGCPVSARMPFVTSDYRRIPAIHRLLDLPALRAAVDEYGHAPVMEACRVAVERLRQRVSAGEVAGQAVDAASEALESEILDALHAGIASAYPAVINATGVLLHTNLGRAPLPRRLPPSLKSYLALEYNVSEGRRGQRLAAMADRIASVCGAASAVMVVLPYYLHDYKAFGRITILGEFLAVSAVLMCLLFVIVDLGRPDRLVNIIKYPTPNSVLFWDMIVLNGYLFLNIFFR